MKEKRFLALCSHYTRFYEFHGNDGINTSQRVANTRGARIIKAGMYD